MYDLDRLKEAADIVEVARALGLDPKKEGPRFVARCPAHNDQGRPNLSLDQVKGAKCFRCGFSADVIDLAAKVKGSKKEGIAFVASVAGVAPQEGRGLGNGDKGKKGKTYPNTPTPPKAAPLPDSPSPYLDDLGNDPGEEPPKSYPNTPTGDDKLPYDPAAVTRYDDGGFLVEGGDNVVAFYRYHFGGLPKDTEEVYQLWAELDGLLDLDRLTAEEGERARLLAGRLGYHGDFPPVEPPRPTKTRPVDVFAALLEYTGELPPKAAAWLQEEKGISLETQAAVGLRWLNWTAADKGLRSRFDVATLKAVGLLTKEKEALHFYGHRLLFPFWHKGEPVFVQGRNIEAKGKDLRFIQPAIVAPVPYNVDAVAAARDQGKPVFICEGATDTLTLRQSGRFAVGIVGTQGFRREWLKAFEGLDVFLAFDGDQAGRDAAVKVSKLFVENGLRAPKVVSIPDGQDVTDFFKDFRNRADRPKELTE